MPSRGTDPPVHLQTSPALKPPEAARSRRPVNAVNRAQVQTLRPQRHLKPGHLGPRRSDPRRRSHDYAEERKHARAAPQSVSRFDGAGPIPCRDGRSGARTHKSPRSLNHGPTGIPGRKPASDGRNMYRPAMISRIVLILILAGILAGCGGSGSPAGRKSVVAAFYPLAYAAERIGGPTVHVTNLTPPGAEPHDLELTPREVVRIEQADLVLYLSHGFQPAVSKAAGQAQGETVDILAGLPLHASDGAEAGLTADPHVWLDPILFTHVAKSIGAALSRPSAGLVADLHRLDRAYRAGLRTCKRHEIVTSHAAFGYLAARYGLHQIAITGLTPESEPTPQQLAHVVEVIRKTHATTVFFETLVSPRLADTVAREVGARTAVLDPIEGLTPDEQKQGDNYLTLMRHNLAALRKALACR